jgi:arginyl-tRNA synthetase
MANLQNLIQNRFIEAVKKAFGEQAEGAAVPVTAARDPKFGHYQCNAAMALARTLRRKPLDIANDIVRHTEIEDLCLPPEVLPPGFINLRLKPEFITRAVAERLGDDRLGIEPDEEKKKIVVDFSGPNIAKELHVGHLRSTIIGDSLSRIFEFLGHNVLRVNHVGDWGTQFGMLIAHLKDVHPEALDEGKPVDLGDIVSFYKDAQGRFKEDEAFQERARKQVVELQSGEESARRAWKILCDTSRKEFEAIYDRLDIEIEERGESYYNDMIPETLEELDQLGLIEESDGARCIFPEGFTNKEGGRLPLIVQKRDGGYNYESTDMTAIRQRVKEEKADLLLYVTDAGQALRFQMLFEAGKEAGWLNGTKAEHVPFGVVQSPDRKRLKTRSGDTVKLRDLLDEAVLRAKETVDEKNPDLPEEKRLQIAETIGMAAVKYADLSQNRTSNYVFSFDKMLALTGNTAPYLLYAYVRIQSIARKGQLDYAHLDPKEIETFETPEEIDLGRTLLRMPEVLEQAEQELLPNRLTDYLYETATLFSKFYTNNRVLGDPREKPRLALCAFTAQTLKLGLSLLGINVIEEM